MKQVVSVKNESGSAIRFVIVECGFVRQGRLNAAASAAIASSASGATGFTEVLAATDASADRAQCRIATIMVNDYFGLSAVEICADRGDSITTMVTAFVTLSNLCSENRFMCSIIYLI